jgi:hypothetical protein
MLKNFAKGLGLEVKVTRSSDEWFADKKDMSEHKSKVEYTVEPLRSGGSEYSIHDFYSPAGSRTMKAAY